MPSIDDSSVAYLGIDDPAFSIRSETVASAREAGWYARTPYGIAIVRYDAARELLKDRRLGQGSRRWPEHNAVLDGPVPEWWERILLNRVGEDHARQRRVFNPGFSPRLINALIPSFTGLAEELLAEFIDDGHADFVAQFARPYATRVICRLIGEGEDRWEQVADWASALGLMLGVSFNQDRAQIENALVELNDFCQAIVDRRLAGPPRDDTVGALIASHHDGTLDARELREMLVIMFFGGVDTTRNQLGLAIDLFIRHPDEWSLLAKDPTLATAAVAEVMRVRPTTTWVTREALETFTYRGRTITEGTTIHLLTAAAGTDPEAFGPDPEAFDIRAKRQPHFAFGGGAHHCPGHFLARQDMAAALSVLARGIENIEPDGPSEWLPDSGNTGPTVLPIRFRRRS